MDIGTFRTIFPEFASTVTYSDARIQFYLDQATNLLNPLRWGTLLPQGTALYVAHNLVLSAQRAKSVLSGGSAGGGGIVASKSVDKVSISYDTTTGNVTGAGAYNLTSYGVQYYQLTRMVGAGPVQVW